MLKGKSIVLVEDNEQDELLTVRALKKNNILNEVIVLRDGEMALQYFKTMTTLPQLILLDLKLPKVSGLEVLKHLREQEVTKRVPTVILTTSNEESDVLKGYDYGANSYVRKPVDFIEFAKAVNQLGLYWLLLNEQPTKN